MSYYYGDFGAYFHAESKEEADVLFERIQDAVEAILCTDDHPSGSDYCGRTWTMGGATGPIRTEDRERSGHGHRDVEESVIYEA